MEDRGPWLNLSMLGIQSYANKLNGTGNWFHWTNLRSNRYKYYCVVFTINLKYQIVNFVQQIMNVVLHFVQWMGSCDSSVTVPSRCSMNGKLWACCFICDSTFSCVSMTFLQSVLRITPVSVKLSSMFIFSCHNALCCSPIVAI